MTKKLMGASIAAAIMLFVVPSASALPVGSFSIGASYDAPIVEVRSDGRKYRSERKYRSRDNVGSIYVRGSGYGRNRKTGQRYRSCMMDEGYGRTRPCDAGGGPN